MRIASTVSSSATPSTTTRLPGSRMPWPCSEFTRRCRAEQRGEDAARREAHVMALAKITSQVGMDLAVGSRGMRWFMRPGKSLISGCSEPPKAHIHFLEAAAQAEQRYAALDACFDQLQRERVAAPVIGLVARMLFDAELRRMHIGAGACQQHAVDRLQQCVDIGNRGIAGRRPAAARRRRRPPPSGCARRRAGRRTDFRQDARSRSRRRRAVSSLLHSPSSSPPDRRTSSPITT